MEVHSVLGCPSRNLGTPLPCVGIASDVVVVIRLEASVVRCVAPVGIDMIGDSTVPDCELPVVTFDTLPDHVATECVLNCVAALVCPDRSDAGLRCEAVE